MTALIFIISAFIAYKLLRSTAQQRKADRAAEERQRIRAERAEQERRNIALEQARMKEEMRLDRERAKEITRRQIAEEASRLEWQKRQDAINRQAKAERERLAREQAKQADMIEKMQFQLDQATQNIDFLQGRIAELDAQLDYWLLQQAGSIPGSKTFEKCQSKIVSLHSQINAAEMKLGKAQFCKAQAQRKLA